MHIFLSGSPSILSTAIMESYFSSGHTLHCCPHLPFEASTIEQILDEKTLKHKMDMVILIAGEDLFNTTYTKDKITKRCADQIKINKHICDYFAKQKEKPSILISVSSVFYYTDGQKEPASERSDNGSGFVANFFKDLEAATATAEESGIRVVHLRLGKVISRSLEPNFPKLPFLHNCIPSVWHDKNRWMSWVSQEDAVRAIKFIWENEEFSGPVNIVSGDTVSRNEFNNSVTKEFSLRKTLPLPSSLLKLLLGQEAEHLFMASTRAIPLKLMEAGFLFNNISLQEYYSNREDTSIYFVEN